MATQIPETSHYCERDYANNITLLVSMSCCPPPSWVESWGEIYGDEAISYLARPQFTGAGGSFRIAVSIQFVVIFSVMKLLSKTLLPYKFSKSGRFQRQTRIA